MSIIFIDEGIRDVSVLLVCDWIGKLWQNSRREFDCTSNCERAGFKASCLCPSLDHADIAVLDILQGMVEFMRMARGGVLVESEMQVLRSEWGNAKTTAEAVGA